MSAAESGDYYQVHFGAVGDGDGPYVLIQRQFEDDDGGLCYVETHDQDYIGHAKVVRATLDRSRFFLELRRKRFSTTEVTFETTEPSYIEVSRILRIMIPCLAVPGEDAGLPMADEADGSAAEPCHRDVGSCGGSAAYRQTVGQTLRGLPVGLDCSPDGGTLLCVRVELSSTAEK